MIAQTNLFTDLFLLQKIMRIFIIKGNCEKAIAQLRKMCQKIPTNTHATISVVLVC